MSIARVINFVKAFLFAKHAHLAIVRRYADANGAYVGELYIERMAHGILGFHMIGASLDTLPLELASPTRMFRLDTKNDFLAPMPPLTLRVGALEPTENERVKRMIRAMAGWGTTLLVRNGFIEHAMGEKI